ncbi:MAG: hypothetical protein PHF11_04880 [Candidatus Omnitrophica bacterium]|nr:hypothetical protein [Candidatus Omnitrophota bacterium]
MFLRKKAQSTAEYAILIGLVVAVAAGILQVALKGGIRQKNKQALDFLVASGNQTMSQALSQAGTATLQQYTEEVRQTKVLGGADYVDKALLEKGGAEKRYQKQVTKTTEVTIDKK